MRLEWLEDLLAVAKAGSFSEAPERRHLAHSAFSRRIRNIEDYVGVPLFNRTRKSVQLQRTTIKAGGTLRRPSLGLCHLKVRPPWR